MQRFSIAVYFAKYKIKITILSTKSNKKKDTLKYLNLKKNALRKKKHRVILLPTEGANADFS